MTTRATIAGRGRLGALREKAMFGHVIRDAFESDSHSSSKKPFFSRSLTATKISQAPGAKCGNEIVKHDDFREQEEFLVV
jgi:hypothetical protein